MVKLDLTITIKADLPAKELRANSLIVKLLRILVKEGLVTSSGDAVVEATNPDSILKRLEKERGHRLTEPELPEDNVLRFDNL